MKPGMKGIHEDLTSAADARGPPLIADQVPNTEVKLFSADGSWGRASSVRVGRCRASRNQFSSELVFLCFQGIVEMRTNQKSLIIVWFLKILRQKNEISSKKQLSLSFLTVRGWIGFIFLSPFF